MSISIVSDVEAQINSYLNNPRTIGLARTTHGLYRTVLMNNLLPFCQRNDILKLDSGLLAHMEGYIVFLRGNKLSAKTT